MCRGETKTARCDRRCRRDPGILDNAHRAWQFFGMNAFYPATKDYGLLAMPLRRAAEAFHAFHSGSPLIHDRTELTGSAEQVMSRLEPLSMAIDRAVLVSHGPGWTAFFQNGLLGSDVFLPVSRMAARALCTGLRVCRDPMAVMLDVYEAPERGGTITNNRRSIWAAKDGNRWSFGSKGEPFPFEDTSSFSARKLRDRFTSDHLDRLLVGLGAPLQPLPDTSELSAVLFQRRDPPSFPLFSFAEVQAGLPWKRS
jgi:hypothetical protein